MADVIFAEMQTAHSVTGKDLYASSSRLVLPNFADLSLQSVPSPFSKSVHPTANEFSCLEFRTLKLSKTRFQPNDFDPDQNRCVHLFVYLSVYTILSITQVFSDVYHGPFAILCVWFISGSPICSIESSRQLRDMEAEVQH